MARNKGVDRFAAAAAALGLDVSVVTYPAGTHTAADAAAAIGCDVAQIVKSLVFMTGDRAVVALVSGANRVDLGRLGEAAGGEVRQASADEVRAQTGYAIGATPPFGHAAKLPTFVDRDLLGHETVWAAAGAPDSVFEIEATALVAHVDAAVVDLAG